MKTLISTLILGAGLVLGGCKDNQKYQDFANFVIKEGKESSLCFLKENKKYQLFHNPQESFFDIEEEDMGICIYGENSIEMFRDKNLNGLDYYNFEFEDKELVEDFWWQSKENKEKYEMLIDSIPKWYAKSKK